MESRYLFLSNSENLPGKKEPDIGLTSGHIINICSIADLINLCEASKKGKSKTPVTILQKQLQKLVNHDDIFIAELDEWRLFNTLFNTEGDELSFWDKGSNRYQEPSMSLRHLTLRKNDDTAWWDMEVYEEMCEYFD